MTTIQEWINGKYPAGDKDITEICDGTLIAHYFRPYDQDRKCHYKGGELNLSKFPNLTLFTLHFDDKWWNDPNDRSPTTPLTKLTFANGTRLKILGATNHKLTSLDFLEQLDAKALIHLNICNNELKDGLKFLNKFTNLESLNISNNNFPESDLSVFSKLVNLKELHIRDNKFKGSFEHLKDLKKLVIFTDENTLISEGLQFLPSSLYLPYPNETIRAMLRPFGGSLELWQKAQKDPNRLSHLGFKVPTAEMVGLEIENRRLKEQNTFLLEQLEQVAQIQIPPK